MWAEADVEVGGESGGGGRWRWMVEADGGGGWWKWVLADGQSEVDDAMKVASWSRQSRYPVVV